MVTASATFSGPQYYNDCLGPVWFDSFAADLVQRLPERPAGDVLEIACGTGLVTRRLRERLTSSVRLVATDLSKVMLDYARAKLEACRDIEWREADALKLPFEDSEFGAVVCGFGMMFVPDRQAALREARRVLTEAGILLFNVWDRIEENPHALANAKVFEAMFPGDPEMKFRTPYDMGDPGLLRQLLAGAGFHAARIETKRIAIAGADPRSIATGLIRGTPRATLIEQRGLQLEAVIDKVTDALTITGGDPYSGEAQAVIVQAVAI
ncbi:MAG: methyltransferase domain-containing protein [Betaproteobacteria bacterium]|nr:MAG: methyltransferase domain-containing protein [Betaproteobacteria bacterium]